MIMCKTCGIWNLEKTTYCENCRQPLVNGRPYVQQFEAADQYASTETVMPDYANPSSGEILNAQISDPVGGAVALRDRDENGFYLDEDAKRIEAMFAEDAEFEVVEGPTRRFGNLGYIVMITAVLTTLAAAFLIYSDQSMRDSTQHHTSRFYATAEIRFSQERYNEAFILYKEFVELYPQSALAPIASEKMDYIISEGLIGDSEIVSNQEVERLMEAAEAAFAKQQYSVPANSSALYYLGQILALDSNHAEALAMQIRIVENYERYAANAADRGRYETAERFYKKVLTVMPDDEQALQRLADLERRRAELRAQLATANKETTEAPEAEDTEETAPVEVKDEQLSNANPEVSMNLTALQDFEAEPLLTIRETEPENRTAPTGFLRKVIDTVSGNEESVSDSYSASDADIANAADLDGGIPSPVYKEDIEKPADLGDTGLTLVQAICQVDVDGRVEKVTIKSVTVLSPTTAASNYEPLLARTVETMKKYRYEPATVNGEPVSFRIEEAISFK